MCATGSNIIGRVATYVCLVKGNLVSGLTTLFVVLFCDGLGQGRNNFNTKLGVLVNRPQVVDDRGVEGIVKATSLALSFAANVNEEAVEGCTGPNACVNSGKRHEILIIVLK